MSITFPVVLGMIYFVRKFPVIYTMIYLNFKFGLLRNLVIYCM